MKLPEPRRALRSGVFLFALAGCGGRSVSHVRPEEVRPKPEGCLIWQDEFLTLESGGEFVGVRPSDGFRRRVIGKPDCGAGLNTLALSSWGDAYAADMEGRLFRIDAQLGCELVLGPVDRQETFGGMSFLGLESGAELIKFIQRVNDQNFLGTIDPRALTREVGPILDGIQHRTELAGGLDGRLFALNGGDEGVSRSFAEIDRTTGKLLSEFEIGPAPTWSALASVRWENAVYGFATDLDGEPSRLFELDLEQATVKELPRFSSFVFGAGTSLCATNLGLEVPE
jgi:hypothetical protein